MQDNVASPEVLISEHNDNTNELDNLNKIDCQVGQCVNSECVNGECKSTSCNVINSKIDTTSTGAKAKRKARSTRRRLNAMINNTSLHFSDTDSEGELLPPRISTPNHNVKLPVTTNGNDNNNLLHPIISVTLDVSDDSSYGGDRRNSFIENLTDVDEILTSEPENNDIIEKINKGAVPRGSLTVDNFLHQGETDLEELSNDENEDVQTPILIKARTDILNGFNGETITTKEGDGPFSIEVRNQMSIDESKSLPSDTPDIIVMPETDTEDMEASGEDDDAEGACGMRESYNDYDLMAASQIVMRNIDKMEQKLTVKEPEDAISDCHTDVEDIE